MKRWIAIVALAAAALVPAAALAFSAQSEQTITVPKGETKTGTYYAWGQVITIDGDVDGDLVCAGNSVSVNGAVHGDVICAGQTVTVNGPVDGSVRVAGQVVSLNGTVGRNGMVAAQTLAMGSASTLAGDLGVAGQTASINGKIAKDLYVKLDDLKLGPDATVGGKTVKAPKTEPRHNDAQDFGSAILALRLYWIFASLIIGLAFVLLAPRLVQRVTKVMLDKPGSSIGWGLVVTLLGPIVVLLLLVTVVGIPLALLTGLLWLVLVATSGIVAGIAAGEWFVARADWKRHPLLWATMLGVPLAAIAFSVPVLGWLLAMVATWWAVGGISIAAKAARG
jgi:cytoskeletal protein CcmA (bactofilin family)